MKQKLFNFFVVIICLFFLGELIINKNMIFDVVYYSLDIWVKSLIPSLFPFFVISDILINYNVTSYIPKFIKRFFRWIFNTEDNVITIFFLSLLSGFPMGARNIRTYYDNGLITSEVGNKALVFTHFANPVFVITILGSIFLGDVRLGYIILLSLYISNIILGILVRGNDSHNDCNITTFKSQSFGVLFINSIKRSIDTLFLILGILTCFLIMASIFINLLNINGYNAVIIKGIMEITMGLKDLGMCNISDLYKVVIGSFFVTFGGISVHMQVISQIINTDIKYKYFLMGRIIGSMLAVIISYILYLVIM